MLSILSMGAPGLSVREMTLVSEEGLTGLFMHSVAEERRLSGEIMPVPRLENTVADWMELADWRIRFPPFPPPPPPPAPTPVEEEGEPLPPSPRPFGKQAVDEGGTLLTPTCVLLETCSMQVKEKT